MIKNILIEKYMVHNKRLITEFIELSEDSIEIIKIKSCIKTFFLDNLIRIDKGVYLRVNKAFLKIWNKNIKKEVKK